MSNPSVANQSEQIGPMRTRIFSIKSLNGIFYCHGERGEFACRNTLFLHIKAHHAHDN